MDLNKMERYIEAVLKGIFPRLISGQNFPYGLDGGTWKLLITITEIEAWVVSTVHWRFQCWRRGFKNRVQFCRDECK